MPKFITKDGKRKHDKVKTNFVMTQTGEMAIPALNDLLITFECDSENIELQLTWQGHIVLFMNLRYLKWSGSEIALTRQILFAMACGFCREFCGANLVEKNRPMYKKTMVKQVFDKWQKEQKALEPVLRKLCQEMEIMSVMEA
jgi:hypothetical protein